MTEINTNSNLPAIQSTPETTAGETPVSVTSPTLQHEPDNETGRDLAKPSGGSESASGENPIIGMISKIPIIGPIIANSPIAGLITGLLGPLLGMGR